MPSITDQYRIIAEGAGHAPLLTRDLLRIDGADRASFLQALVSNEVASLEPGAGVYAVYLTPQGRMVADLGIHHRGDHFVIDVPAGQAAALAERLDMLVFAEDVRVSDITAGTARLLVVGTTASAVLASALGIDAGASAVESLPPCHNLPAGTAFVARSDDARLPSFRIYAPEADRDRLVDALTRAGAPPMTPELVEALRIDAGRPVFGRDMTEETIPLEAGLLDRAISTEKGCYVGQEVVIRILHRGGGRVAKRLARLAIAPGGHAPAAGAVLQDDGRDVGRLTSVAPALGAASDPASAAEAEAGAGGWTALGYVHRDSAERGRRLQIAGAAGVEAVITGFAG